MIELIYILVEKIYFNGLIDVKSLLVLTYTAFKGYVHFGIKKDTSIDGPLFKCHVCCVF